MQLAHCRGLCRLAERCPVTGTNTCATVYVACHRDLLLIAHREKATRNHDLLLRNLNPTLSLNDRPLFLLSLLLYFILPFLLES